MTCVRMREEGSRLSVTYLKLEMERGGLRVLGISQLTAEGIRNKPVTVTHTPLKRDHESTRHTRGDTILGTSAPLQGMPREEEGTDPTGRQNQSPHPTATSRQ